MAVSDSPLLRFNKISNTQWQSSVKRTYQGTITFTPAPGGLPDRYNLLIQPGAISSDHNSLRSAKNGFRTFLLDKPVG